MTKPLLFCFDPVADLNAELLILGSMPGQESLTANQYYANHRNAFWKIMADILGFDPGSSYETRLQALKTGRIALWDVLQSCTRTGSLDARIDANSISANAFQSFFDSHQNIRAVFFNGAKAESTYRQHILPTVSSVAVSYRRLPSTSPAHASLSYEQKLQLWQAALKPKTSFVR
ncbi:MAG: DNA-deoxyinosine glycosylase [Methylobacter sp.]|nr:DNA-deoxyinosine glycosylase [Candidatus Methylobacter titanis]